MLQMARASARTGVPSLALSLEMTNSELSERMLFSTERVSSSDITAERVDWQRFEQAAHDFEGCPIYLDESPQTLDEVCSSIMLNHRRGQCDVAFIDYLQLMSSSDSSDSLYRQVTDMTKRLKKLAKKLKIPIILLAQLNRNSVSEKRPPMLHDLRDSGSIEQDADIVLMLEKVLEESNIFSSRVNMYVRKNRGGLGGDICIRLRSNQNYTNFYEIIEGDEMAL
jgi:replicative DNA helicase